MNFKTTLIFLAVFIVLGGAYFFFGRPSPDAEQSEAEAQKIREIYTLNEDRIQRIRLSFKDESYQSLTLAKNAAGAWQLTVPFAAEADAAKVNEMLNDLLEKKVKQTLEAADYAQYGLQPPNIQIDLWTGGEAPARTFLIGNKTVNYSVYTQEQSESHIFLIESSALDDFTKSPSDLQLGVRRQASVCRKQPRHVSTTAGTNASAWSLPITMKRTTAGCGLRRNDRRGFRRRPSRGRHAHSVADTRRLRRLACHVMPRTDVFQIRIENELRERLA